MQLATKEHNYVDFRQLDQAHDQAHPLSDLTGVESELAKFAQAVREVRDRVCCAGAGDDAAPSSWPSSRPNTQLHTCHSARCAARRSSNNSAPLAATEVRCLHRRRSNVNVSDVFTVSRRTA